MISTRCFLNFFKNLRYSTIYSTLHACFQLSQQDFTHNFTHNFFSREKSCEYFFFFRLGRPMSWGLRTRWSLRGSGRCAWAWTTSGSVCRWRLAPCSASAPRSPTPRTTTFRPGWPPRWGREWAIILAVLRIKRNFTGDPPPSTPHFLTHRQTNQCCGFRPLLTGSGPYHNFVANFVTSWVETSVSISLF